MTNTIGYVRTEQTQTTEEINVSVDLNSAVKIGNFNPMTSRSPSWPACSRSRRSAKNSRNPGRVGAAAPAAVADGSRSGEERQRGPSCGCQQPARRRRQTAGPRSGGAARAAEGRSDPEGEGGAQGGGGEATGRQGWHGEEAARRRGQVAAAGIRWCGGTSAQEDRGQACARASDAVARRAARRPRPR